MNRFIWNSIWGGRQKKFLIYETLLLLAGALLSVYPIQFMEKVIDAAVYPGQNAIRDILLFGGIYLVLQIVRALIAAVSE